jgi:uncharacterized protein
MAGRQVLALLIEVRILGGQPIFLLGILVKPSIELLRASKDLISASAVDFGVSNIRVFGSIARGTATESSDIDLLVQMESGRTLLDLVGFEQSLEDALGFTVDVVVEGGIHPALAPVIYRECTLL